ncbi:MgtC/SapB family protein [Mycobacterium sp.]|uniref:MgtC/SapB family protein n=1 Tax=Mycobacterium sp. TaxID=1785 RepID=UPI002BA4E0DF|nr:MgtC/SapB family protein [Mycobacterium sp.]HME47413.1 MgtC/SapB family protein [Mycobacterium sp.]
MPAVELLVRVGLATLLGVAIGIERQWRARMAGLQTMALVSMGAALFLILGAYTFHHEQDPTRVAAQIVTGIGFLGAGVIMKQGSSVTGLNTAATLWATAAVGALAGAWMWREALTGAAIVIAGNVFLYPLASRMDRARTRFGRETPPTDYVFEVDCNSDAEAAVRALIVSLITGPNLHLKSLRSVAAATTGAVRLVAELSAYTRDDETLEDAARRLSVEPDIRSVRWTTRHEGAAQWTSSASD